MRVIQLLVFILPALCFAQKDYAKKVIADLASEQMHGRGYVLEGDKLAANYIAKEYKAMGAKSFGKDYFQRFNLGVNTFPGNLKFGFVSDREEIYFEPGIDFVVTPNSGSAKGEFTLVKVDSSVIESNFTPPKGNIALLIDFTFRDLTKNGKLERFKQSWANKCPVLVLKDGSSIWGVGRSALKYPIIEINKAKYSGQNKIEIDIENKFIKQYQTQNVIGYIPAKKKKNRDKYVVFSAHYDHLGMMGKEATMYGANDNASGTAMMLSLMKHYKEHPPKYTVIFIAFGAEEAGLVGSKYFVDNPLIPLEKIKFLFNVDLLGTGEEGLMIVNATENPKQFKKLQKINKCKKLVKKIGKRGKAANSDHYWFAEKGVPAFFSYTLGGVAHYHNVHDKPEGLSLYAFNQVHELIWRFIDGL